MDIIFVVVVINFRCVCYVCLEVCVWFCGACVGVSWSTGTGQSADVGLRGSPGERERGGGWTREAKRSSKREKERRLCVRPRGNRKRSRAVSVSRLLGSPGGPSVSVVVCVEYCLFWGLSVSVFVCVGGCLRRWLSQRRGHKVIVSAYSLSTPGNKH